MSGLCSRTTDRCCGHTAAFLEHTPTIKAGIFFPSVMHWNVTSWNHHFFFNSSRRSFTFSIKVRLSKQKGSKEENPAPSCIYTCRVMMAARARTRTHARTVVLISYNPVTLKWWMHFQIVRVQPPSMNLA